MGGMGGPRANKDIERQSVTSRTGGSGDARGITRLSTPESPWARRPAETKPNPAHTGRGKAKAGPAVDAAVLQPFDS
jgi:hypothetical protein